MFQRVETRGRALAAALLIATAGLAGCGSNEVSPGPSPAQAQAPDRIGQAHAMVDQGATLLDVRTPGEFSARHLEGAMLIPVQELAHRIGEVPRERPVVVYCASGRRSAAATSMLREQGYEVHDLGGIPSPSAWNR